jgi:hypothetical protein
VEKKRRQEQVARYAHEMNLCECLERLAVEDEQRALRLLEDAED